MQHFTRREAAIGLAAMGFVPLAGAQGKCSASGITLDEALAAWLNAQRAAELDKSSFLVTITRLSKANFKGKNKAGNEIEGVGVLGTLSVNGVPLGDVLENDAVRIKAGTYKGVMRYVSEKNFVQGPLGAMSETGDFLLEVSGVQGRTDLLIHTGTKPWHSEGCILAGAAKKTVVGGKEFVTINDDTTLKQLRLKFYGTDTPVQCPNKTIRFTITDIA